MAIVMISSRERLRAETGLARLLRLIVLLARRADERRTLLELNDDQLRDIGLAAHEIRREACRWPWDGRERG
jgi:uncharacterized protein YjiS (DUF1127 family)